MTDKEPIRTNFQDVGEKLYKLDESKAKQEAARFFLDILRAGLTQAE